MGLEWSQDWIYASILVKNAPVCICGCQVVKSIEPGDIGFIWFAFIWYKYYEWGKKPNVLRILIFYLPAIKSDS